MKKLFVATVKVISVERIDTLAAASYEISNRFVKLIQEIKIYFEHFIINNLTDFGFIFMI